jgi:hypothetical protein
MNQKEPAAVFIWQAPSVCETCCIKENAIRSLSREYDLNPPRG